MSDHPPPETFNPRNIRSSHLNNHEAQEESANLNEQPQNMISEEEVRAIITEFNQRMNQILLENEEIRSKIKEINKSNKDYEAQLEAEVTKHEALQDQKEHFQQLCAHYEENLKIREQKLVSPELSEIEDAKDSNTNDDAIKYREAIEAEFEGSDHKEKLLDLLNDYEKMKKDIMLYSFKNDLLIKENEVMKEQIIEMNHDETVLKDCVRCHGKYAPLSNHEQACIYHPGKLKYYSCRGCGVDEYWSCCNKCSACLKGCREGKHLSA